MRGDDNEFKRVLSRVASSLEEYEKWYARFQLAGMSPELDSLDSDLLARFNGIFAHARLYTLHGLPYLSMNISSFASYCKICTARLKTRLSG